MSSSRHHRKNTAAGPTPADVALEPGLPYPDGWSAVAFSGELGPQTVLSRPLQGEDVVLYRVGDGSVRAVRPYCPHLGAHLSLGRVEGDDPVCLFHSFAFGPDGACVRTPYGRPPPKARLSPLPVCEVNGAVFVWRHHDGRMPHWRIPVWHALGHLPPRVASWELAGHAQEVMENSVDLGHFATLHGSPRAELRGPVAFGDERFHVSMRMSENVPLLGEQIIDVEVDGYGMSCLHADMETPGLGIRMCTMVMASMVAPNRMQLRQSNRLLVTGPARLPRLLAGPTSRILTRLLAGPLFKGSCAFTAVDFPIWNNKKYVVPPVLAHGDGPIGAFRHWAGQFYPRPPGAVARQSRSAGPARGVPARRQTG